MDQCALPWAWWMILESWAFLLKPVVACGIQERGAQEWNVHGMNSLGFPQR